MANIEVVGLEDTGSGTGQLRSARPGTDTYTVTGSMSATASNATVTLSPTGTGTVAIQPAGTTTVGTSGQTTSMPGNISYTGTLTGGTGAITIGTNQLVKDSSGNVGIGTNNPNGRLHVANAGEVYIRLQNTTSSTTFLAGADGIGGYLLTNSAVPLVFYTNNSERMRIDSSGNVGIGTGSPSYQLQLSTDSAAKPSTNTWTIASDARIKNVTGEYTKGLDAVCALRPVTYEYNGAAGFEIDGKENISIFAQEAIEHFPECVGTFNAKLNATDKTETELYNWNGHALTFALVNAVKELKAELEATKAVLKKLGTN